MANSQCVATGTATPRHAGLLLGKRSSAIALEPGSSEGNPWMCKESPDGGMWRNPNQMLAGKMAAPSTTAKSGIVVILMKWSDPVLSSVSSTRKCPVGGAPAEGGTEVWVNSMTKFTGVVPAGPAQPTSTNTMAAAAIMTGL